MTFDQAEFDIRCEWGVQGVQQLAPISDVIIIVDVLSFSTCVEVAVSRGATIFPYRWRDASAQAYADSIKAQLAEKRGSAYSLSPASLMNVPPGLRLVLPSLNGSTLSLATGTTPTLIGCLRNCRAVAKAASQYGTTVAVIPAGERWCDETLRPSVEDLIGAGAIIQHLRGSLAPEAQAAAAAWNEAQDKIFERLKQCSSGKELIARGFATDVEIAAQTNVSACVPLLTNGAFTQQLF